MNNIVISKKHFIITVFISVFIFRMLNNYLIPYDHLPNMAFFVIGFDIIILSLIIILVSFILSRTFQKNNGA